MLLNEVIMGKAIKLTQEDQSLTEVSFLFLVSTWLQLSLFNFFCIEAPQGYDSVVGEPGGVLNYDESIGKSVQDGIRCHQLISRCDSLQGMILER